MYNRVECGDLQQLFIPISQRSAGRGVYFVRVCTWSPAVGDALWRYHEAAREKGAIIEGQLANPDERQLGFLHEMLGDAFENTADFLLAALERWMPRMQPRHRAEFADALHGQLDALKARGKTDSILKNIYSKLMCWLYYRFERLVSFLGQDDPPRVLYEARSITAHELILLRILSAMGADILLLEAMGDAAYLKQDPQSAWSQLLKTEGTDFPQGFTLKQFRKERMAQAHPAQQSSFPRPTAPAQPGKAQQPTAPTQQTGFPRPTAPVQQNAPAQQTGYPRPTAPAQLGKAQQPTAPTQQTGFPRPTQSAAQNPTASAQQTGFPRPTAPVEQNAPGQQTSFPRPTAPAQPGKAQQPITLTLQPTVPQNPTAPGQQSSFPRPTASAQSGKAQQPTAPTQQTNSPRPTQGAAQNPTVPGQQSSFPRPTAPVQQTGFPRPTAPAQPGKAQPPITLTLQPTAPQSPTASAQPGNFPRPTQSAAQNPAASAQPGDSPRPLTLTLQPSGSRSPITLTLQPTAPQSPAASAQPGSSVRLTPNVQPGSTPQPVQAAPQNPTSPAQPGGTPRPTVTQGAPTRPAARDPERYFPQPTHSPCTNAWMKEAAYSEILTPPAERGDALDLFYNAFIRVKGVPDKQSYLSELYHFHQKLKQTGRSIVIVEPGLEKPGPEATEQIRRRPYRTVEELIVDIAGNLPACANVELQRLMQRAFVRTMKHAAQEEPNLNRLLTSAVYLLCWVRAYQSALFQGFRWGENPCFILMGGCRSRHDALFIRYLSQLPVDVLILACDLHRSCTASGDALLQLSGMDSMPVPRFPRDAGSLQMQTVASNAEEELIPLLYTDSGLYRDRQFSHADAVTLRTTCDELFMLWNQELRFRPNFATVDQTVSMPVLYAKVAGVAHGKTEAYWQRIKQLLGEGTYLIKSFPHISSGTGNPCQALALKVLRNGRLRREELKAHRQYPFALLRGELQEFILDKLQLMLDRRLIKGTFVNGMEYTVVATVLNLNKELVRRLQSFDFTRKNPKLVAICTGEQVCSVEDAILLTFLNLVGFDIALFVPTGYQTIERHLNDNFPVEHQSGDYIYDLQVPDFDALPPVKGRSWLGNLLKRGN